MKRAIACAAAIFLAFAAAASPRIEPGALEPFSRASAMLFVDEAYPQGLQLHGTLAEGDRVLLFVAKSPAWRASLEARFFVPDGLRALELVDGASGLILARLELGATPLDARSLDARQGLRRLNFPLRGPGQARPTPLLSLSRAEPASAARAAVSRLFVAPRRPAAFAVLAAWAALLALAAGLAKRAPEAAFFSRRTLPAWLLACLAAACLAAALGRPGAARWELALPPGDPPWSFEAALLEDGRAEDARVLGWAPASRGPLAFLAFHDPLGRGVPLEAWASGLLRFSSPPVVELGADGVYRLEARRFLMAWRLDDAL